MGADAFVKDHPFFTFVILVVGGLSGILVNSFILYKVIYRKVFGRSFGWIWISRGIAYFITGLVFLTIVGPGFLIGFPALIFVIAMQVALVCSLVSILSNFLIAMNRCLLIVIPFTFKHIFTRSRTLLLIALTWLFTIGTMTPAYVIPGCLEEATNGNEHVFLLTTLI
ncbi:hypothetical protein L596_012553 [Steinernema carpocapsae]|uniref:G-protein coupled receptors family 1 profile domain-containing protein n=1 Tax=Steinernema carpocapsae TaxID=34508 RepID=A0A4U5NXJ4_STECR|nr:hypothetical protein L596_012553 [Steinernema carpocapsae]